MKAWVRSMIALGLFCRGFIYIRIGTVSPARSWLSVRDCSSWGVSLNGKPVRNFSSRLR